MIYAASITLRRLRNIFSCIVDGRFRLMKWLLPVDLAYPALLLAVTGHCYFSNIFPTSWSTFLDAHNIRSLNTMLWRITAINAIKALICLWES